MAEPRECKNCGVTFSPTIQLVRGRQGSGGEFCSNGCAMKFVNRAKKETRIAADVERFWLNVNITDGCWEWIGSLSESGYGTTFSFGNGKDRPHRISYRMIHGPIPDGMCVCHKCDNRKCCKPDHLFLGSIRDNNEDMKNKNRHAYGENNGCAKLTKYDVVAIRADRRLGTDVASSYEVSASNVSMIKSRKTWRHL